MATAPDGLGRAKRRGRTIAHIGQWQVHDARYLGQRKNLRDPRRIAAVQNFHITSLQPQLTDEAAA